MASFRIGTRNSPLAQKQAKEASLFFQKHGHNTQIIPLASQVPPQTFLDGTISRKERFTHHIQHALLSRDIDVAVHSMKDMPTKDLPGLCIGAIPERKNPFDAWISSVSFQDLALAPQGSKVGTSSLRRGVQLLQRFPHLQVVAIEGNVGTRLDQMKERGLLGIVLACAGLERLGFSHMIANELSLQEMMPAVGQGALAITCSKERHDIKEILQKAHHKKTAQCIMMERGFLKALDGSCQTPIAGYAFWRDADTIAFCGMEKIHPHGPIHRIEATYRLQEGVCPETFGFQQGKILRKNQ